MPLISINAIAVGESIREPEQPHEFQQLVESIMMQGLRTPIIVREIPRNGLLWFMAKKKYALVHGYRRLHACIKLNKQHIEAQVVQ